MPLCFIPFISYFSQNPKRSMTSNFKYDLYIFCVKKFSSVLNSHALINGKAFDHLTDAHNPLGMYAQTHWLLITGDVMFETSL